MLALKNLLRRKIRSLFSILQIAVAIAVFVSIVGVTKGLQDQFRLISQVFAYDLIVQQKGSVSPFLSSVYPQDKQRIIDSSDEIEDVSLLGMTVMWGPPEAELSQPVSFMAVEHDSQLTSQFRVTHGRALQEGDTNHILIGRTLAEKLGIDLSDPNTPFKKDGLEGEPPERSFAGGQVVVKIVGIFETPLEDVGFLSGQALIPLGPYYYTKIRPAPNIAIAHLNPGRRAKDDEEVAEARAQCDAVAPQVEEALNNEEGVYRLYEAKSILKVLKGLKQVELIDKFALAISILAALVSAIGVANTMLMSVFDRTREIGLLRAIGWSRTRIVLMIVIEGIMLALIGGIMGVPIGLGLIKLSSLLIELGWLELTLDPELYFQAVVVALIIGFLGSLYPALRAANLQPTEALRYE